MEEVRYYYQSVWTSWAGDAGEYGGGPQRKFLPRPRKLRPPLGGALRRDASAGGVVDGLKAAPQQRVRITLPYDRPRCPRRANCCSTWPTNSRRPKGILPAGHTAARAQLPIREYVFTAPAAKSAAEGESLFVADNHKDFPNVAGNGLRLDFSRKTASSPVTKSAGSTSWPTAPRCAPTSGARRPTTTSAPDCNTKWPSGNSRR